MSPSKTYLSSNDRSWQMTVYSLLSNMLFDDYSMQQIQTYYLYCMACSKYEYVKKFQETRTSLPETYIMVRIDGRGFTKFCSLHSFQKPNDLRAIRLMNQSAKYVCESFTQIFLAYGQSDEYSFVFNKNTTLFSRRIDKILSCVVSAFTSAYVFNWKKHFEIELKDIPTFDSRIVTYPNDECIKDYFRWRQVDCHINNLYNTTFWCMVKKGMGNQQVEKILKDTNSAKKNQILFSQFQINYNSIEQVYRRGTFLLYVNEKIVTQDKQTNIAQEIQKIDLDKEEQQQQNSKKQKNKKINKQCDKIRRKLIESHQDCIKQQFWKNLLK